MGAFFDSIHVRTENSGSVQKALEQIAKEADCKFLLGPALNGWTSIFPSDSGKDDEICAKIAKLIPNDVFHLIVHDDDIFIYCFYRNGQLIDEYNSWPDSFEEVSETEKQKCQGRPELFQDLLQNPKSLGKLKTLLNADKFTFESERMTQFVKLLGLSNALSSYDYLQSEDWDEDEIEGWKQFIHIENQPTSAEDYNNRGEAKLAKDNLDGALADFKKAIELNPDLVAARDNCGRVELAKIDRDKTLAETWNKFGRIKKDEGDLHSALVGYNKAIELNPSFASAYNNRGVVKKAKTDFDGAMADFNKAIELEPSLSAAYVNRGDIKRDKGDFNGALDDYGKAIELKSDSAAAYNNRGELKRSKKDLDGALQDYNKAIELKSDSPIYFCNRGLAKLSKRDLEGAFADCNKAIELKPDFAAAYNNRGMVKQVKGDLDGALEDYDRAISLKPLAAFRTNRDNAQQIKNKKSEA
jgi:tetratricopeptide (TPR) repeat protein